MVGSGLDRQQFFAGGLAICVTLAHFRFFGIGHARGHRSGRHEHDRQMAEGGGAHEQARHDFVADAEHQAGIEGIVAERHGGGQRDHITAEQGQLHAGLTLGDAVAHGRHAAGDLRRRLAGACPIADLRGIALIGLVCG